MIKLHYFNGRGRAETTRWMLAINRLTFENVPVDSPNALTMLRLTGKLPFDQMPLLEIDELKLSQSSAMVRYLARRGGFYGKNDFEGLWCDMIAGAVADFAEVAMQAAFKPTREIAIVALKAGFKKFGPRFESRLRENGSGFCVGVGVTFADVVLVEALSAYRDWCPDILADTPELMSLYNCILSYPGVADYLISKQRYAVAGDDYVIDVASVLQRSLPSHMPDPNRFLSS
jgi:glutathione S-transferase